MAKDHFAAYERTDSVSKDTCVVLVEPMELTVYPKNYNKFKMNAVMRKCQEQNNGVCVIFADEAYFYRIPDPPITVEKLIRPHNVSVCIMGDPKSGRTTLARALAESYKHIYVMTDDVTEWSGRNMTIITKRSQARKKEDMVMVLDEKWPASKPPEHSIVVSAVSDHDVTNYDYVIFTSSVPMSAAVRLGQPSKLLAASRKCLETEYRAFVVYDGKYFYIDIAEEYDVEFDEVFDDSDYEVVMKP